MPIQNAVIQNLLRRRVAALVEGDGVGIVILKSLHFCDVLCWILNIYIAKYDFKCHS